MSKLEQVVDAGHRPGENMQSLPGAQAAALAQLESLLHSAPIGLAFFDRAHRYVRINEQLAVINGLPVEAHLGRTIRELLPINAQVVEPILDQVFTTGEAVNDFEVAGETPAAPGVVRHWLTSFFPVVDGDKPRFVGATVVEITERKRVEAALRASEARFRATFEQAAVGMAHVALDGRWLHVNRRLCDIVGYTREALSQTTFQAITYRDDLPADLAQVQRLLAGEIDGYQMEKRYVRPNGAAVWCNLTVSLQRHSVTNQPEYFIAVVEDISERKAAENRLNILAEGSRVLTASLAPAPRAQALADLLVDHLVDWCVVNLVSDDGVIELAACAHREPALAARIRTLAEELPLSLNDDESTPHVIRTGEVLLFPTIDEAMFARDPRLSALRPLGLASLMFIPLTARGQTLGSLTLARADANDPLTEADLHFAEGLGRRMGLAVDNARLYLQARAVEAKLRQLTETLEQRVLERTAELERSNRELDQFAYVASHDLKAPLRAIDNLSAWIEEDAGDHLPPQSRGHLEKLRGRVQRMERLLDDLLAYSRAGRIQHQPEVVELDTLVRSLADMQGVPPGFRLVCTNQDVSTVRTLRTPLEMVLRNLIGNAIKHHHRGDGVVSVDVQRSGDRLEFVVADDGPGIAPAYHQRIFEMFQTLQPRDEREGSGIGLAIVKKVVESLNGEVWVDSSEQAGARFHFTWPIFA